MTAPEGKEAYGPHLTPEQAAQYLGVSRRYLYTLRVSGRLPSYKLAYRCRRYARADLDAFLERCRQG